MKKYLILPINNIFVGPQILECKIFNNLLVCISTPIGNEVLYHLP